ncbi:alginate export family protein [bacterium]|nr:alginate export family protein [bacterium]
MRGRAAGAGAHAALGRQVLHYGAGRVLSEYDWWNAPYSSDAARLQLRRPAGDLTPHRPERRQRRRQLQRYGRQSLLHADDYRSRGLFRLSRMELHLLDLYLIHLDNHNADTRVPNLGAPHARWEAWDYDLEAIFQPWGEVSGRDLSAWSAASRLAAIVLPVLTGSAVLCGYDYATGDSDPRDDEAEGFFSTLYADNYSLSETRSS